MSVQRHLSSAILPTDEKKYAQSQDPKIPHQIAYGFARRGANGKFMRNTPYHYVILILGTLDFNDYIANFKILSSYNDWYLLYNFMLTDVVKQWSMHRKKEKNFH